MADSASREQEIPMQAVEEEEDLDQLLAAAEEPETSK